jgi:hypothetical protein
MANLSMRLGGLAGTVMGAFSPARTHPVRKRSRQAGRPARKASATGPSRFQAVEVRRGLDSCAASLALEGQRFLSRKAPTLPLPGCDRTTCGCRFAKFADRRSGGDRRFIMERFTDISGASFSARRGRGRRRDD